MTDILEDGIADNSAYATRLRQLIITTDSQNLLDVVRAFATHLFEDGIERAYDLLDELASQANQELEPNLDSDVFEVEEKDITVGPSTVIGSWTFTPHSSE